MQIKCPHCSALLYAPPEAAGTTATCKICNGKFEIPAPVAQLTEPAVSQPPLQQTAPANSSYPLSPGHIMPPSSDPLIPHAETNVWTGTPSQWVGFGAYFWCVLLVIAFAVAVVLLHRYFWFGLLLPLLLALGKFLRIRATRYDLTSQRLKITTGIVDRKEVEIELFRLRDLSLEQGFLQRMVNVGTVQALSSDKDAPAIRLKWVNNPDAVKDRLRTFIMEARRTSGTRDIDLTDTSR